ncbi:MAG: DeoR/GlpR family DNA-binding transcription regulator [Tissierellia bacterium]|nr:DeoR/GlpR family DNA-binding transcription regulator [Tissierellia bacterium]
MIPQNRLDEIKKLMSIHRTVTTKDLCEKLYSSPSTIRRDLIELENAGIVRRIHGGATLIANTTTDFSYAIRAASQKAEKEYITKIASNYLRDDMSLFIDTSTTASYILPYFEQFANITIITHCIEIAYHLKNSSSAKVFVAGGQIKRFSSAIIGEQTFDYLSNFRADLSIISCKCLDTAGFYEADYTIANLKRLMVQQATKSILLCDSTKFDTSSTYSVSDFVNIDAIITDKKPDDSYFSALSNTSILWR